MINFRTPAEAMKSRLSWSPEKREANHIQQPVWGRLWEADEDEFLLVKGEAPRFAMLAHAADLHALCEDEVAAADGCDAGDVVEFDGAVAVVDQHAAARVGDVEVAETAHVVDRGEVDHVGPVLEIADEVRPVTGSDNILKGNTGRNVLNGGGGDDLINNARAVDVGAAGQRQVLTLAPSL